jgi:hypothetical protein
LVVGTNASSTYTQFAQNVPYAAFVPPGTLGQPFVAGTLIGSAGVGPAFSDFSSEADAPPTDFTTLVVIDTTALTGGTYAWSAAGYVKIAGPLSA